MFDLIAGFPHCFKNKNKNTMHCRVYKHPHPLDTKQVDNILIRYDFIKQDNTWKSKDNNIEIFENNNFYYIKIDSWNHKSMLPYYPIEFEAKIKNIIDLLNSDVITRLEKTTERYIEAEKFIVNLNFFQKLFILRKYSDFIKIVLTKYKF